MGKFVLFFYIAMFICLSTNAQKITINGFVEDKETGERLIGTSIYDQETGKGTITNSFGFYSITLNKSVNIHLTASFVGYNSKKNILSPVNDTTVNFYLIQENYIDEVIISGEKFKSIEKTASMSTVEIPINQINSLPSLMGETDVLRTFQLMPGVKAGKEGTSGLYVRGGSPDQNLFLLDDVPLYYVNHIGGFISIFDPSALNSVKLIKGGFPARYGGRLSSVMDIRLKEGNIFEKHGSYTIGLVSTKFFLEGPLKKDTSSFMISVRRCNIDLLTRLISLWATNGDAMAGYTFYDFNVKLNRRISLKDRLYLSVYGGRDRIFVKSWDSGSEYSPEYKYKYSSNIRWGNYMGSLRWNHIYNSRLFNNTTLSYTKFFYINDNILKQFQSSDNKILSESQIKFNSGINDFIIKTELEYYPDNMQQVKAGIAGIFHIFNPGVTIYKTLDISNDSLINSKVFIPELSGYIEDMIHFSSKISTNIGLHSSMLFVENANYLSLQPRFLSRYLLTDNWSFKISYSKMVQPVHLLTNSGGGLPTDLWVPSTEILKPEISHQFAAGFAHTLSKKYNIEFSTEFYYKTLSYIIELKEGTSFFNGSIDWHDKVEPEGTGKIYGAEILLQKKEGKTTGWIGYTYSNNRRKFDNINSGRYFPYRYDRTHDISVVLTHEFNEYFSLSAAWVYGTGNPLSLAVGKYDVMFVYYDDEIEFEEAHIYNGRNGYRMPSYHRLDIGLNFSKTVRKGIRTWNVSIYNVYNRLNPFFLFYNYNSSNEIKLYKVSLFPIMPSVSYSYKF
jgi:hypothetical protein